MDRRTFIVLATVGALVDAIPALAQARRSVGTVSQLSRPQDSITTQINGTPVAIVRNPANNSIVAVSRVCTHAGCSVDWRGNGFACPCHGAQYSATGSVTRGPARQNLTTFPVTVENNTIFVQA